MLSGCGSSTTFANRAKPSAPVALTVYINDKQVSLSPGEVGAGLVTLQVTNQATHAQSLVVSANGSSTDPVASTGPINPQATTQLEVNLVRSGRYEVSVDTTGQTDAQKALGPTVRPATLVVGPLRPNDRNKLLLP